MDSEVVRRGTHTSCNMGFEAESDSPQRRGGEGEESGSLIRSLCVSLGEFRQPPGAGR